MSEQQDISTQNLEHLKHFQEIILKFGTLLNLDELQEELLQYITQLSAYDRVQLFVADPVTDALHFSLNTAHLSQQTTYDPISVHTLSLYPQDAPFVQEWLAGDAVIFDTGKPSEAPNGFPQWFTQANHAHHVLTLPLNHADNLIGLLVMDNFDGSPNPAPEVLTRLKAISPAIAVTLINANTYKITLEESAGGIRELHILQQIDRELNDNIQLEHVFNIALDWALRFTAAHVASVALYNQETDDLKIMRHYGYEIPIDQIELLRSERAGIAQRVARSGYAEVIPDVSQDKDFVRVSSKTHSHMSVPVMREDRVIAVITVESRKINGFDDYHQDFVEKLAARAGVAIDNARLFEETKREREKLSHILNNTADIVIAYGPDGRLILVNPAAFSALRLSPNENYIGEPFEKVFADTKLMGLYAQARGHNEPIVNEVTFPNDRTFHVNMTPHQSIGWIIVMHDITPFKEMDQLKSELIATVSHDLKQPLSVMNGYTELLLMHGKIDATGINFIEMVRKAIKSMRQLIDDLLDLAKIETGIALKLEPTAVSPMLEECIQSLQPQVLNKQMLVVEDFPSDLPPVLADQTRLHQILTNLIGNAVKYTQPEGQVTVTAEQRDTMLRITVQDNGMGISPEDQSRIFDRFYRVRRPETDSIDGTGLGLAIVKTLVDAHNGKIGLESRLGEGTTFYLSLPLATQTQGVTEHPTEA
jgi:two-component system phosphate regulon sensor histidine kinase PhoR